MDKTVLFKLNVERQARRAAILLGDLETGDTRLINELGPERQRFDADIAELISQAFCNGKSRIVNIGGREHFLNVYLPPARLVVIGAVHISQCLAAIAKTTGFDLEIIDPRTAFATPERFEDTNLQADWPQTVLAQKPLDPYSALIAVTHDPKIDDYAIISGLQAECFYVGALGSRKTHAKRLERLRLQGIGDQLPDKIHAPIGMDIGAANPAEIAVAILAQVIDSFRKRGVGL